MKKVTESEAAGTNHEEQTGVIVRPPTPAELEREAKHCIELAVREGPFMGANWSPEMTATLQGEYVFFEEKRTEQEAEEEASKAATIESHKAIEGGLLFRDRLVPAIRTVSKIRKVRVEPKLLHTRGTNKPERLVVWLTDIRPVVETMRDPLARSLGVDPVARLDELRISVPAAKKKRLAAKSAAVAATKAVRDAAGKLAGTISLFVLAGKIAFARDHQKLQLFRKSVKHRNEPAPEPQPQPTPQPPASPEPAPIMAS
jgi:hypothetical protein